MLVTRVPDLLQMGDKSVPEAITGKLLKIYPIKNTQYGTMQNVEISGDGSTIKIVFSGKAEIPKNAVGKELHACAVRGKKGLTGLMRKDNDYNGKITPEIWVYEAGELAIEGLEAASGKPKQSAQEPPQRSSSQPSKPAPSQSSRPDPKPEPTTNGEYDISKYKKGKKRVIQYMNLMSVCYDASYFLKTEIEAKHGQGSFTPAMAQAIATHFSIEGMKEGIHLEMPTTPVTTDWKIKHGLEKPKS